MLMFYDDLMQYMLLVPCFRQGRINHWGTGQMLGASCFWGASRLNIKILLYWFLMFLG